LTAAEVERDGEAAIRIEAAGESRTERLLWTVMLGDLVSLELAEARQVEPLPIEAIDRLKASLARD
jgi:glucose/mannose-6-phosphate isomerase